MDEAVLVIDKIPGPSSFDVVRQVRNYVRIKRVGHAGSLDPFATGVLVLLTGKATKLSNALLNADKIYEALLKLGESTDSMDRTGSVVETMPVPTLNAEAVETLLKSYVGEWMQIPPMFSAKKIQGVRLYELARKNLSIPREPIPVQLYSMKLLKWESPYISFEVHCSKGTYIRSLADEIARKLGTVGHLAELRRLSCGEFKINESLTVEQLLQSGETWKPQGYRNYVKLLSAEGVVRTQTSGRSGFQQSFAGDTGLSGQRGARSPSPHLPRHINNGNSILN